MKECQLKYKQLKNIIYNLSFLEPYVENIGEFIYIHPMCFPDISPMYFHEHKPMLWREDVRNATTNHVAPEFVLLNLSDLIG